MIRSRILIIDDHDGVRARLKAILQDSEPDAVFGEAATARLALQYWLESEWDVALVDLHLPDRSGLALIGELVMIRPSARIVVVSALPREIYEPRVEAAGAFAFVPKQDGMERLVEVALQGVKG